MVPNSGTAKIVVIFRTSLCDFPVTSVDYVTQE